MTTQATDKKLAAEVALGIYADPASLEDGWKNQVIFPLNQGVLKSDEFINNQSEFFSGQTANKDVYIPAENAYKGFIYSPLTVYYYAQLQAELVKINAGEDQRCGCSGRAAGEHRQVRQGTGLHGHRVAAERSPRSGFREHRSGRPGPPPPETSRTHHGHTPPRPRQRCRRAAADETSASQLAAQARPDRMAVHRTVRRSSS